MLCLLCIRLEICKILEIFLFCTDKLKIFCYIFYIICLKTGQMTSRSASVMSSSSGKTRHVHSGQSAVNSSVSPSSSSGPIVLPVSVSSGQWYASSPRARASDQRLRAHLARNNRVREVSAHAAKVHTVGWSCDGRRLASGSLDRTVIIYTLDRDRIVCNF